MKSPEELKLLIEDCRDYLKQIKGERLFSTLKVEVERNISRAQQFGVSRGITKSAFKASIEALYNFVDPFDKNSDRNPEVGFEDDLEMLRMA